MVLLKGTHEQKTTTGRQDTLYVHGTTKSFNSTKTINTCILGASDFLFPVALEKPYNKTKHCSSQTARLFKTFKRKTYRFDLQKRELSYGFAPQPRPQAHHAFPPQVLAGGVQTNHHYNNSTHQKRAENRVDPWRTGVARVDADGWRRRPPQVAYGALRLRTGRRCRGSGGCRCGCQRRSRCLYGCR